MYRVILVPLDGSPLAERALPQALVLAHLSEARIVLLQVIPPTDDGVTSEAEEEGFIRAGEAYLRELAKREAGGLEVETAIRGGEPAMAILEEVKRRDVDLVVMSTHGRSGPGRWIYGSVADAVMRHSPVPVILVPASWQAIPHPDHPPRILVPLDGSTVAEEVLRPVGDLATAMGADLVLVRVVEPHPTTYTGMDYLANDPTQELIGARAYLERVATDLKSTGRTVSIQEEFGFPVTTIQEQTLTQEVAMIAMATHGSGGITRLLLGSVATGLVQRAGVPVFLVRPVDHHREMTTTTDAATKERSKASEHPSRPEETISAAASGDPHAAEDFLRGLANPDVGSYFRLHARLREVTDPRLWECLIAYLGTRQWSGHSLGSAAAVFSDGQELRRRIHDAFLPDPGSPAEGAKFQALRTCARTAEPPVREVALELLGRRGDLAAIDDVIGALASESFAVKEAAVQALGRFGGATASAALIRVLHDQHNILSRSVTRAFARMGADAVPTLIDALDDPDAFVRWHAAEALADIADPRAIDPLIRALEDSDATVRWKAARGLVREGRPGIVALLRALETHPLTPWLAQGAARVLHDAPLRSEAFRLQPVAEALYHSTASVEVPLRAAEVLREIEELK